MEPPRKSAAQDLPLTDMPITGMAWPTSVDDGSMQMVHTAKPKTLVGRAIAWLGMWHPAIVHFPIALLLSVALLERLAIARKRSSDAAANHALLSIALATASSLRRWVG